MYMTPQVRRVAVLLARIMRGTRVQVQWPEAHRSPVWTFIEMREEENIVRFEENGREYVLPLDRIVSAYLGVDGTGKREQWLVRYEP